MADIIAKIAQIRAAILGIDVRESIASGIESINTEVVSTTAKETTLETTFEALVINAGSSNAEIVVSRGSNASLPDRLSQVDAQLSHIALDVTTYGAVGDGMTDDTEAIQAAVDTGKNLFFPLGTYLIKDTTTQKGVKPISNQKWTCAYGTVLKLGSSRCNIISNLIDDFMATGNNSIVNFVLDGFTLDSDCNNLVDPASVAFPTGDNYGFGVYLINGKDITIQNCTFKNTWYGGFDLFGVDGQNILNNTFDNNGQATAFYPNYTAFGSDGSGRAASRNVKILGNRVLNGSGFRANGGVNNGVVYDSENWDIADNVFSNGGIYMGAGRFKHVKIHNNTFGGTVEVTGGGELFSRDSSIDNITITNNILNIPSVTANRGAIYTATSNNLSISGNIITIASDSLTGYAIAITSEFDGVAVVVPKNAVIEGNIITTKAIGVVFQVAFGAVKILNNQVNCGVVQSFVIYCDGDVTTGTDLIVMNNHFKITSGVIHRSSYKSRIFLDNVGLKTYACGTALKYNNQTQAHMMSMTPLVFASVVNGLYEVYVTVDATNITFQLKNFDGTSYGGSAIIQWFAIIPDYLPQ